MRTTILITTFILLNVDLFSQGGVNVKYIPIDSVDASFVGQSIKIDFKGKRKKEFVIQKARHRDTVNLFVNNRQIELIEVKGTGVDYWYFDKEYLKSNNYQKGQFLKINEINVQKVDTDSILFRMTLELYKNEKTSKLINVDTHDIWIKKDKLDGVLIKKSD